MSARVMTERICTCCCNLRELVWICCVRLCCGAYYHRNLMFYNNEIPLPNNDRTIEDILTEWFADYEMLETDPVYHYWLFPSRTTHTGIYQQALTNYEARELKTDILLQSRVYRAFAMMLDFFGMHLSSDGNFGLAEHFWLRRGIFERKPHTCEILTHILISLQELGFEDLSKEMVCFLADLVYVERSLEATRHIFENHWLPTQDKNTRLQIQQKYYSHRC